MNAIKPSPDQPDYYAYVDACRANKQTPLAFNVWMTERIRETERRIAVLEQRMNEQTGDGR